MNGKDCEHLGYLLSEYTPVNWDLCKAIFAMDKRIEQEYDGFQEVKGRSDEINERAAELASQYNGRDWSILPSHMVVKSYAECLEEARKEVYGDDYSPEMFK